MAIPTFDWACTLDQGAGETVPRTTTTTTTGVTTMTCNCHPDSPFHWAENPRDSIFLQDVTFRAKGSDGRSGAQIASATLDKRREDDPMIGTIKNIGTGTNRRKEEERMLAYRQFGQFSRAKPSTKMPNKHEEDAPSKRKLKEQND